MVRRPIRRHSMISSTPFHCHERFALTAARARRSPVHAAEKSEKPACGFSEMCADRREFVGWEKVGDVGKMARTGSCCHRS